MTTNAPLTEVREHLIAALNADLVGPFLPPAEDGEEADEVLPLSPSRWYLTGFLAPARGRELEESDGSEDDELPAGSDEDDEDAGAADPEPKRKNILPASMGLSVLLPPGTPDETVRVTLRYAEYKAEDETDGVERRRTWVRQARDPVFRDLALDPETVARGAFAWRRRTTSGSAAASARSRRRVSTAERGPCRSSSSTCARLRRGARRSSSSSRSGWSSRTNEDSWLART